MRFKAPLHVSAVAISAGEFAVIDGFVDLPDDMPDSDAFGLAANGFVAEPSDEDLANAKKVRKAKDKADKAAAAEAAAGTDDPIDPEAPAGDEAQQ